MTVLARHDRALIAWDRGDGPMFGSDGKPVYHHYRVVRDGREVAMTYAEGYIDDDVAPSRVYRYQVKAYRDAEETEAVDAAFFTVSTTARPPADIVPPTAPSGLRGASGSRDIVWRWNPSSKLQPDEMLAYLVESSTSGQPRAIVWERVHPTLSWRERGAAGEPRCYRLRAIDRSLNISEPSEFSGPVGGWTVYTYTASNETGFTLRPNTEVEADVLRVGGGGGGGWRQGAGGGGGEVLDLHGVTIRAGVDDGAVTIGAGSAEIPGDAWDDGVNHAGDETFHGNLAEPTLFGTLAARPGGYGGGGFNRSVGEYYPPADGASGGGGNPWGAETEDDHQIGRGADAIWGTYTEDTHIPYDADADVTTMPLGAAGYWEDGTGAKFWKVVKVIGNDGGDGEGHAAWYNITAGGGGGAHQLWRQDRDGNVLTDPGTGLPIPFFTYDQFGFMQSTAPRHGGHGVPCDIRGWHGFEETDGALYTVDWYGGGGAGAEQKVVWSYPSGQPGYGGGGAVDEAGAANTGGGGGGSGYYGTCGPAGGSGILVVRISTADEDLVTYPLITGTDPDPEHVEFGLPICLTDAEGVTIRRLPAHMRHEDECGDESCPRTYEEIH